VPAANVRLRLDPSATLRMTGWVRACGEYAATPRSFGYAQDDRVGCVPAANMRLRLDPSATLRMTG
jgi:hypothetical protein